jgi:hypothetical protein
MPKPAILNNIEHKDLKVITERSERYGDNVMYAFTFPAEFRDLQAHYPIVFHKSADGTGFDAVALLGFQDGENLFLENGKWDSSYIPLTIERQPFMIGRAGEELMVHIDMDNPRVSTTEGEPLFLPHGANSDYLDAVSSLLGTIHDGMQSLPDFIATLTELELLEGFVADIVLNDGSQNRLVGFYTINEERLAALDSAAIDRLHKANYLPGIYYQLASLSKFRNLIDRKNRRQFGQG